MDALKNFFYRLPGWLVNKWWLVVAVYGVLTVAAILGMERVWTDDSLKSWFGKDSEMFLNIKKFEKNFGTNEDLYIVYEAKDGDVFSKQSLAALDRLHNQLSSFALKVQDNPDSPLSHIREVISLINVQVTEVDGNNLYTKELIGKNLPNSGKARQKLKESTLNNSDLVLALVSEDARYAAISIKTDLGAVQPKSEDLASNDAMFDFEFEEPTEPADDSINLEEAPKDYEMYLDFIHAIKAEVAESNVNAELDLYYAGLPELIAFQIEVLDGEMGTIFMALFIIIAVFLLLLLRHVGATLWALLAICFAVFFTMGLIGWSGVPTSSLSDPMLLLIIVISVADSIHIISTYKLQRQRGEDKKTSLAKTYQKAGFSCFLTTVTTVIGFGSLWIVKPSIPVANFGFFCAFGLVVAFLTCLTILPMLLTLWGPGATKKNKQKVKAEYPISDFTFNFIQKNRVAIIAVFAVVTVITGAGISKVKIDTNTLQSFDESTYIRKAFEIADRHMAGTQNIDLMVDLNQVDGIYDADVINRLDEFQQHVMQDYPDLVVTGISIANILKRIRQQFHGDDPAYYSLPKDSAELRQLLFLFNNVSPEERRKLVSDDFDATRVTFTVRNSGSTQYVDLIEDTRQWADKLFMPLQEKYPNLEVINSGGVVMFMHLFDRMAWSQVVSFSITLLLISITLFVVFRSFPLGGLAIIASVFPIVIVFGLMGWLGVDMNPTTMVIAPIILGLAVDDSIHLINKLRAHFLSEPMFDAVKHSLRELIVPLTLTSIVLSCGMLTMLYSSDNSFQSFGYLSAIAFVSALLADLLLIPAVCMTFLKNKKQPVNETLPVGQTA